MAHGSHAAAQTSDDLQGAAPSGSQSPGRMADTPLKKITKAYKAWDRRGHFPGGFSRGRAQNAPV